MNPTRLALSLHEAGHIGAACLRGIPCDASLGTFAVECGAAAAMTVHYGGDDSDHLAILCGGLAASKLFSLGDSGTMQDLRDIELLAMDESAVERARQQADIFAAANKDTLVKLASVLSDQGSISESETRGIFSGQIDVAISEEFAEAMQEVAERFGSYAGLANRGTSHD